MIDDPRRMPRDFYHEYSGSLGKLDKILSQYSNHIQYTLSSHGQDCKVELYYAKKEDDLNLTVNGSPGDFTINGADSLDTTSFLKAVNEGIEKKLDDAYRSLMEF